MSPTRKKSVPVAGPETPLQSTRRSSRRRTPVPASLSPPAAFLGQRKAAVLFEMPTIRWLLAMHHFPADGYSDDAIADALLETCPRPDDFWLRSEHLALAIRRFNKPA